jgi:hypothetical protein
MVLCDVEDPMLGCQPYVLDALYSPDTFFFLVLIYVRG